MNRSIKEVKVALDFGSESYTVGRMAMRDGVIYFEYDDALIQRGIEISPIRLPLQRGVIEFPRRPFEGLAGVFSDSLPDGWGRLLRDRLLRSQGVFPDSISSLDRLAYVGSSGMGALTYEPDISGLETQEFIDLDQLAIQTEEVIQGSSEEVLMELVALNGSSAGARPKALIAIDSDRSEIAYGAGETRLGFEPWLVKFSNKQDGADAGAIEYVYALMAKEAGLTMPDVHLFSSQKGAGYFAVKRFDRTGNNRKLHMATVSGLLHSDFRVPALDYEDLLNLVSLITKDIREVEKMYRQAVFNVLANNRDDHAKNFSFLMDEKGAWTLAPAYDLTFSSGPNGEQSMLVMGEGKNPSIKHLLKLGMEAKLSKKLIDEIIGQTQDALARWSLLAKNHHVTTSNIALVDAAIKEHRR